MFDTAWPGGLHTFLVLLLYYNKHLTKLCAAWWPELKTKPNGPMHCLACQVTKPGFLLVCARVNIKLRFVISNIEIFKCTM